MFFKKSLPPDPHIIQGIQAGGQQRRMFENILYEKYFGLIKDASFKHKLSEDDAASVYSDSIIAVIDAIVNKKFQEKAQLKTYLFQIFQNKCVDFLRKNSTKKESVHQAVTIDDELYHLADDTQHILQQMCNEVAYDKLFTELQRLGEKCKQMLMAWAEGYSDKEIAEQMAYNNASVAKTSRLRCMEKLKENYFQP